jgi:hypothetical protein
MHNAFQDRVASTERGHPRVVSVAMVRGYKDIVHFDSDQIHHSMP